MPLDTLKRGVRYGMQENLNIQFVYPGYALPKAYEEVVESVDHVKIKPACRAENADIVVMNGLGESGRVEAREGMAFVLRLGKGELFASPGEVARLVREVDRLNVVLTDVESFRDEDFAKYKEVLALLTGVVEEEYAKGRGPQLNILTDRVMLEGMNNCGAGDTSVTLAPDGRFYVCPAFYFSGDGYDIGGVREGLNVKNAQLYKLDHAPLCRRCDAYQCRRCVWLNRKTTLEVNTPSHEQCVVAHLERNASRELLARIRKHGAFIPDKGDIVEIDYLDPFEVREEW